MSFTVAEIDGRHNQPRTSDLTNCQVAKRSNKRIVEHKWAEPRPKEVVEVDSHSLADDLLGNRVKPLHPAFWNMRFARSEDLRALIVVEVNDLLSRQPACQRCRNDGAGRGTSDQVELIRNRTSEFFFIPGDQSRSEGAPDTASIK